MNILQRLDSGIVWAAIMFFWIIFSWLAGELIDYTKSRFVCWSRQKRRRAK